ncbi:tRNA (adenine(22)-N(1))-methyltransferase TrmK [Metabacillus sp. GX 13764]|uniref:tRNA (adenine(22)-N(1))-methyltransferase n=1 Tax=Metabacillus kandeliae TaxID=2900151 RepID=UPI001E5399BC|nr:tRNA (adenine(22)-N(1))-methyltransferase TrmK [Metabacillus kandeliae]MCD7033073.1 tRNA (adenine(22)-N(1))-methyltransferase TrmK [Metabacillus kandeliae]
MNEMKLSQRLQKVADYIPEQSVLADIGSDHAYLPCYAVKNGIARAAIAGEVVEGPYLSAVQQVQKSELESFVSVRKGDGLQVLEKGEAGCITIAGMGGALIAKILEQGKDRLSGKERLVLQPNIHAMHIRKWLLQYEWELKDEEILEEDGKIYEILVAEKGNPTEPYQHIGLEAGMLLGPFLAKEKNEVFLKKWTHELKHWSSIIEKLNEGTLNEDNLAKKQELEHRISIVRESAL